MTAPESFRWVLAVDLGTSGLKVGAVTLDGAVVDHVLRQVPTDFTEGATQDADGWWTMVAEAAQEIAARGVLPLDGLVAVGLTGEWGSTVAVDADGNTTGRVLLWRDDRGAKWSRERVGGAMAGYAPGAAVKFIRYTAGLPSANGADPTGHALFLRHGRPDQYARTATLLEPVDYLALRLTGRRAATPASMIASWLTDNRKAGRPGYLPSLVKAAGRDADRLPELLPTGSVVGTITPEAAARTGMPVGVPVVAGVPDLHSAWLGCGTPEHYQAHIAISTTAWVSCSVPFKKTDALHQIASVPGLQPDQWLVVNNHETGGACLQWLRDQVVRPADGLAGEQPVSFDDLTALAAQAPAGSGGVLFTPWLAGERSPVDDRTLRGAFLNISLRTDRSAMVRAVMEGVAYNARWLAEAVEKFVKQPLPSYRILGGGAASDLWCQIHADVLDRTIERVADPLHTNLRGVALYAAARVGVIDEADIASRNRVERVFTPDPANRAEYDRLYNEYRTLYGTVHKLYRRLNGRR